MVLINSFSLIDWLEKHLMPCFFKSTTGIDCPGCGNQRSIVALLKGDVVESFIVFPALIFQMATILFLILHLIFKFEKGAKLIKYLFFITMIVMVGNYILKIIKGQVV